MGAGTGWVGNSIGHNNMARSKKNKVLSIALASFGLLLALLSWQGMQSEMALSAEMVETIGTIESLTRERQEPPSEIMREMDKGEIQVTVAYDGYSKLFVLDQELALGSEVTVWYQRSDPTNARLMEPGSFVGSEEQISGISGTPLGLGIGIILILTAGGLWFRRS